ncbi:MAG: AraC family transcriptional regulator ligand-binding domain-containing protein [Pseudomonadota bacterium]
MTTARTTTALVSIVLNTGIEPARLADVAKVPVEWLRTPTQVAYEEGMRIWAAAEILSEDPAVGLHSGAGFGVDQLGSVSMPFVFADTLRAALKTLPRLLALVVQGVPISVDEDRDGSSFRYRSPGTFRHGVDAMFAAILAIARQTTRTEGLRPVHVHFQSARPPNIAPYVEFFGVEPVWEQVTSELRFGAGDLDRPLRGADPSAAILLEAAARETHRAAPAGDDHTLRAIDRALETLIPRGEVTVAAMAAELHISARTLQRRLQEAGTSFRERRDKVLQREATRLLARRELSLDEVAERLGFSTRPAFSRAYRRWTGRSPSEARRTP